MTNSEARKIINSYKPPKGFYNLSKKPDNLSNKEYAQILGAQIWLAYVRDHQEDYKKGNLKGWIQALTTSADYQKIVLKYWKIEEAAPLNNSLIGEAYEKI